MTRKQPAVQIGYFPHSAAISGPLDLRNFQIGSPFPRRWLSLTRSRVHSHDAPSESDSWKSYFRYARLRFPRFANPPIVGFAGVGFFSILISGAFSDMGLLFCVRVMDGRCMRDWLECWVSASPGSFWWSVDVIGSDWICDFEIPFFVGFSSCLLFVRNQMNHRRKLILVSSDALKRSWDLIGDLSF